MFNLKPLELQLGFLKLLKGTKMVDYVEVYQYEFEKEAPYEIISNKFLSKDDLKRISKVEKALEDYYNHKKARDFINHLFDKYSYDYFDLFELIGSKMIKGMQKDESYHILMDLCLDFEDRIVLYKNYHYNNKVRAKALSKVENKKVVLHELVKSGKVSQKEAFTSSCVEKIDETNYFVYLINSKKHYLIEVER